MPGGGGGMLMCLGWSIGLIRRFLGKSREHGFEKSRVGERIKKLTQGVFDR